MDDQGQSSLGFEEGTVAAMAYLGFVGILLLILERKSDFVRFHAVQSSLGFLLISLLWLAIRGFNLTYLAWAPGLTSLVFSLSMMYKAYYGEEHKLPVIGHLALSAVYDTNPEANAEDLAVPANQFGTRKHVAGRR